MWDLGKTPGRKISLSIFFILLWKIASAFHLAAAVACFVQSKSRIIRSVFPFLKDQFPVPSSLFFQGYCDFKRGGGAQTCDWWNFDPNMAKFYLGSLTLSPPSIRRRGGGGEENRCVTCSHNKCKILARKRLTVCCCACMVCNAHCITAVNAQGLKTMHFLTFVWCGNVIRARRATSQLCSTKN